MTVHATLLCGAAAGRGLPAPARNVRRLLRFGPHANVFLHVEDLRRAIGADLPEAFLDLLDVAAYVYAADQAVARGGDTGADWGAGWRRALQFAIPVRLPELWNSPAVREALTATLGFLSEDEYHFAFEAGRTGDAFREYKLDGGLAGEVAEVLLFSGGLDSLAGAAEQAVRSGRKVALVHHRSNPKPVPTVRALWNELARRAAGPRPAPVPVRVYKAKGLTRDRAQRARSFLFVSLGAAVAAALGLPRVLLYENGVVSANLPLCAQVVGARASRTTHPRVLAGMTRLLTALAGRPLAVENPFQPRTKADVVKLLADAGCADLIRHTRSCAHPPAATNRRPHCGVCSQCLDRRLAVAEAGQGEHDPADTYRVDILGGEIPEGQGRTMVAVYAETALRVARMAPTRFFGLYGEVSRLLEPADRTATAAAHAVFALHHRHADGISRTLHDAARRQLTHALWGDPHPTSLLRMVQGEGAEDPAPPPVPPAPAAANYFRPRGRVWEVRFAGRPDFILLPSAGAAYLHVLLQRPGRPLTLAELIRAVAKDPGRFALAGNDADLDRQAKDAARARLFELNESIAEARKDNNTVNLDVYTRERDELLEELRKSRGFGRRSRKERTLLKRLRSSVYMAIKRALKQVEDGDPALAAHLDLKSGCFRCGLNPCYDPRPPVSWDTGPEAQL
jgi:7-cyano-7-deazaguanine synthase in queuosine biosynthesis